MAVIVRDVTLEEIELVAPLWEQAWRPGGRRSRDVVDIERAVRRRVEVAAGGGFRFLAAWSRDTPVGLATVSLTDGMAEGPGLHVHMMHVAAENRYRGVGTALLAEIASWATRLGSDRIVVDVPPGSRDIQRWYARWGFGPFLQRRVATTESIRRHLRSHAQPVLPQMRSSRRMAGVSAFRRVAGR